MAPKQEPEIRLRLVVREPVPGVLYSLQDKANAPVSAQTSADGSDLVFDLTVRVTRGGMNLRWLGDFVRREGPERRFVYIAIGKLAGDAVSCWERRMKIDIHTIAPSLVDAAHGGVVEGVVCGRGKDGSPACATVALVGAWRAVST